MAGSLSFGELNNATLYVHTTFFSVPSSDSEHWGCFHTLANMNSASVKMGVLITFQDPNFNSFE